MAIERYNAREAEARWQAVWEERGIFATPNDDPRKKYYVLEMFPYPSGRIHMGHVRNYAMGDVVARFKRATGFNVLHPMGWDAFGMPAENAAMERRVHPKAWTYENIAMMKAQLKSMGLSLDWRREIATCDPSYYKHQQKMFLDFLRAGLVERKLGKVNWDPVDQTVLANEQGSTAAAGVPARRSNNAKCCSGISRSPGFRRTCSHRSIGSRACRRRCAPCSATGSAAQRASWCVSHLIPRPPRTGKTSSKFSRRATTRCSARNSWPFRPITRSRRRPRQRTPSLRPSSPSASGTAQRSS